MPGEAANISDSRKHVWDLDDDPQSRSVSRIGQLSLQLFFCFVVAMSIFSVVFIGYQPDFKCSEVSNVTRHLPYLDRNFSGVSRLDVRYSKCNIEVTLSESNVSELRALPCVAGIDFSLPRDTSFRAEWSLVCDKEGLTEVTQTFLMTGQFVGGVAFSALADRIGRKPVFVACAVGYLLIAAGEALAPDIVIFSVCRFVDGALGQGAVVSSRALSMEMAPQRMRSLVTSLSGLLFSAGGAALAVISYFMQGLSWRYLQLVIAAVSLYSLTLPWCLEESPRWITSGKGPQNGRQLLFRKKARNRRTFADNDNPRDKDANKNFFDVSEAEDDVIYDEDSDTRGSKSLRFIDDSNDEESSSPLCRKRGRHQPGSFALSLERLKMFFKVGSCFTDVSKPDETDRRLLSSVQGEERFPEGKNNASDTTALLPSASDGETAEEVADVESTMYNILDFFRHKVMLLHLSVCTLVWLAHCLYYYGVILNSQTLFGNRFLNFAFLVLMDVPVNIAGSFLMARFERRVLGPCCEIVAGLTLVGCAALTQAGTAEWQHVLTTVLYYVGLFTLAGGQLVLSVVTLELFPTRLRSAGFGLSYSIGTIGGMAAPFFVLLGEKVSWAPTTTFGVITILAGISMRLLPETRHRRLPDTIREVQNWT